MTDNVSKALEQLSKYKDEKSGWGPIADLVRQTLRQGQWDAPYSSPTQWLEAAADASGYTPQTLRRLIKLRDFIEVLITERVLSGLKEASTAPFGSLEILQRIYDLSRDKALSLARPVLSGEVTYRELRDKYNDLVAERPKSISAAKTGLRITLDFKSKAAQAIKHSLKNLYPQQDVAVLEKGRLIPYAEPDIMIMKHSANGIEFVDGFEFRMIKGKPTQSVLNQSLSILAHSSTFFHHYWVFFPHETNKKFAEDLAKVANYLEMVSVGIGTIKENSDINVFKEPDGNPLPDRRIFLIRKILQNN